MTETETLVNRIKEGLQEKKGRRIVLVDMTELNAVCSYFVICEGTSNTHINAVTEAALEYVRLTTGLKPLAIDGLSNATWVAVDYGDVMVHVFDQASRQYYNLEHLWSDAKLTVVPDLV